MRSAAAVVLVAVIWPGAGARELATAQQAAAEPDWHQALDHRTPIGFFIAPSDDETSAAAPGDSQLAHWALAAWAVAAEGRFELVSAARENSLIHLYWVSGQENLYGEMRPFLLGDKRGAAVFVVPETRGLGREIDRRARRDPLFRDTVIYLTCLHELGHAFGLAHTAEYDDIMYSFQHGGDIVAYFQRYRNQIETRADIAAVSGFSPRDIATLRALYERPTE